MKKLSYLLVLIGLYSCTTAIRKKELKDYTRWAYQLQGYDKYTKVFNIKDTLWVIDYSKDGSAKRKWTKDEIQKIKENGNLVLSYLSIGEAEGYRYYFKKMPKNLLLDENKDWASNYRVKYWDSSWQDILWGSSTSYLDQIIEQGFDGVYLDIVDAFESYPELEKADKAEKMAYLIMNLSSYAKSKKDQFYVIPQNGVTILKYLKDKKKFFSYVDGLGQESLYFFGEKKMNNKWNPQKALLPYVDAYLKAGKKVFLIEYVSHRSKVNKLFSFLKNKNIIPLVTEKSLSGKMKIVNW